MKRRALLAGNWKMNGTRASLVEIEAMAAGYDAALRSVVDLLLCPPATLLAEAAAIATTGGIATGAQDCHTEPCGAFTGAIAAEMIADLGARYVIVGHSERRQYWGETDELVHGKALAAARAGLTPIICIGETLEERAAGRELEVLGAQINRSMPNLDEMVVAYEPVWAIGTGKTPSCDDVSAAHAFIRRQVDAAAPACSGRVRILYGGSIKPSNAAELLHTPGVDGALVGGASLKASDFLTIARACLS